MLGDVSPQNLRVISSGVQYPGHDHVDVLELARWDGRKAMPVDLSAVTRLVLVLLGSDPLVLVDSVTSPSALRAEGGKVIVDLSAYAMEGATYSTHLVAYDAEHPRGQVLVDNRDTVYQVEVRSVGAAGIEPPPFQSYVVEAPTDGALYGRKDATWALLPTPATVVESVNGESGAVVLTASSVGAASAAQGELADTAVQPSSLSAVAASGSYSDLLNKPFIPTAPGDLGAATALQGALADTAVQPGALAAGLSLKVDKAAGYGLSQENFTPAEKTKLAGLDGSLWRGTYTSLGALQAAHPTAEPGSSAHVDAGVGVPVALYIWDNDDDEWVVSGGDAAPLTAAQVKTLYESNADTNAYTNAEKAKLGGIAVGATANADTDSLSEGAANKWFTTTRVLTTVLSGLSMATGTAVIDTDSVLAGMGKLQRQVNDLVAAVSGKQDTLVSATNIKTVNGSSLLGAGDLVLAAVPAVVALESAATRVSEIGDAARFVVFENPAASTYTVEPQTSVAWAANAELQVYRKAAGTLTLTAGAGVTLKAGSGGTLVMTDGMAALIKRVGVDTWVVVGQTVPA